MSYILEALKKSQAERQLGNAPTIHAIPLEVTADAAVGGRRERLWMALAAVALVLAAAALWTWRQQSQPAAPAALTVAAAPAGIAAAPPAVQGQGGVTASPQSPPVAPPAFVPGAAPVPAAGNTPAPLSLAAPAPVLGASPVVARAVPPAAPPAPVPRAAATTARPAAVAIAAAGSAGADDQVRSLRELPEAIQREVPQVAIGGYIYSKNPADRLLLVDKVLRREGEQVGPGLTLEKLLPKAAVMNYRGYRYRVPY